MKKRAAKVTLYVLEAIGLMIAVVVAFVAVALWRAENGPVSLNAFRPAIEKLISEKLPEDYHLAIGSISIQSAGDKNAYLLTLNDAVLTGMRDASLVSAPVTVLTIDKAKLLKPGTSWRAINIPTLMVKAQRTQREPGVDPSTLPSQGFASQQASAFASSNIATFIQNLRDHPVLASGIDEFHVEKIRIDFDDAITGQNWSASSGVFHYDLGDDRDFSVSTRLTLSTQQGTANLNLDIDYQRADGILLTHLTGKDVPLGDLASLVLRQAQSDLTAPISGEVDLTIGPEGQINDLSYNFTSSDGKVRVGNNYLPIKALRVSGAFDQQAKHIRIDDLGFGVGNSSGSMAGTVKIDGALPADLNGVMFDLTGEAVTLDTLGFFEQSIFVDRLVAQGRYDVARQRLNFDDLQVETDGVGFRGTFAIESPRPVNNKSLSLGIFASLKTDGRIDHAKILKFWPIGLAPRSRDWVRTQIKTGYVQNLDFTMDLPVGMRSERGYIPDEALNLTFDVGAVTAEYIAGMTLLTKAYGKGILRGNSLQVDVRRAKVKDIAISRGRVKFPHFNPSGAKNIFAFSGDGDARQMLEILDEEPLEFMTRAGLNPAQIAGRAKVDFSLTRQFRGKGKSSVMTYDGTATFDDLTMLEAWGDLDLNGGKGAIRIETDGLTIDANALLGVTPVTLSLAQNFRDPVTPTQLSIAGEFDSVTADLLGIPTRSFLRGPVAISLDATGAFRQFKSVRFAADFTNAQVLLPAYGWSKDADIATSMNLNLTYLEDRSQSGTLRIAGEGVDITGQYSLFADGRLSSIKVPRFFIDQHADFAFEASRKRGEALNASISGRFLNIGPILDDYFAQQAIVVQRDDQEPAGNDAGVDEEQVDSVTSQDNEDPSARWGRGVSAKLRFDRLMLRNQVEITDASLDLWHNSTRLEVFSLSGFDRSLRPISVELSQRRATTDQPGDGAITNAQRIVEAETTDIGNLMEGIFAITSLRSGEGKLRLTLSDDPVSGLSGALNAKNLYVVNAPILAKLLAAGSLDGLVDLANNQGIALESVATDFLIGDGMVKITDANAIGPSVGISSRGTIALEGGAVDLTGALAPIYQINSFLGKTPIIGDLLVNRKGEGVLALAYEISGDVTAPSVTIKPLSALAPGFLRRAFEEPDVPDDE